MIWKKWAIWYRGAIIGLIIGCIASIGLFKEIEIWKTIASPGLLSCNFLTECSQCTGCTPIGLIFNLIYGFIIGALIGWIIQKNIERKKTNKQIKRRKKK